MISPILWAACLCVVWVLKTVMQYLWDPKKLRRFPNQNLLSGITNLGYIIERYRGFRSKHLHEIHKKSPIVRLGPNSVSFSSVDAIRTIYGHSTTCIKGDMYSAPAGLYRNTLDVVDIREHARKRRYLSNAFATRNLENWEFKVTDKAQRLVRQFDRICDTAAASSGVGTGTVEFRKWASLFTIEAIADMALSHQLGCLDRGDDFVTVTAADGREITLRYIQSLHAGKRATSILVWSTGWFRFLRAVLSGIPGYFRSQWHQGQNYDKMVQCLVHERIRRHLAGEDLDDFVRCALEDKNGNTRGLDVGEIEAEVNALLDAGSDTTAIALTHLMYNLLRAPEVLVRLREEVDEALESSDIVASYSQVKSLPYLRACLDESLRLLPPVSFGLNRKTPPEGVLIDGQWIPGDTTIAVPAYTAHRNPDLFPNPEAYWPERWLEEGAKEARVAFIAFSTGARGCIGRNITYIEQSVLLATLVHRYDFALPHENWELEHEEAFNLWPGPMPLSIQKRSRIV